MHSLVSQYSAHALLFRICIEHTHHQTNFLPLAVIQNAKKNFESSEIHQNMTKFCEITSKRILKKKKDSAELPYHIEEIYIFM